MKKIAKIALLSLALVVSLTFLTGCSQVSLTGSATDAPVDGGMGTPPDGGTPPTDGGTPPSGGAPTGAPAN